MNRFSSIAGRHAKFGLRILSVFSAVVLLGIVSPSAKAVIIDLTTVNSEGTSGGAIFRQNDMNESTGSGTLDPFLRISANTTLTEGFNTSPSSTAMTDAQDSFTTDMQLSELSNQVVNIGGTDYYQFVLDINEPNSDPNFLLIVQSLEILTSDTRLDFSGDATDAAKLSHLFNDGDSRYSLGGDSILLNAQLESGSGRADMLAFIPVSFFAGDLPSDYIYLYSAFGWVTQNGYPAGSQQQGGFEEWATIQGGVVIPEPSHAIFGAFLLVGLVWVERGRIRSFFRKEEQTAA